MEQLTKQNHWDEMERLYPKAMDHFKNWINAYKQENNWEILFNAGWFNGCATMANISTGTPLTVATKHQTPKYHELPVAMQFGIFIEFISEVFPNNLVIYIRNKPKSIATYLAKLEDKLKR